MGDLKFVEVSEDVWKHPLNNRGQRPDHPIINELMKGKTLFIEADSDKTINGLYESARRRGKKLSMRKTLFDNKKGYALKLVEK